MDGSPGEEHVAFMQWATSHGIEINGIAPARFPGRRLGMIATRPIEENETILSVPVSLMLTIDSVPESFASLFPEATSNHGIIAAFLMHGDPAVLSKLDIWRKVWPSWEEFQNSMPIFWPAQFRVSNSPPTPKDGYSASAGISRSLSLLPPSISGLWNSFEKNKSAPLIVEDGYETRYQDLLARQEKRLQSSWANVLSAFPETDWTSFAYNWAIVNSRCFYYVSPGMEEPEDWNDAVAMVPFADYFNHADNADCDVKFDGSEYTFKATRCYKKGEEIYMSYGSHSNDFLLAEYGFYLENNASDGVYLDDIILADLTTSEKEELAAQEYLGNYVITQSGTNTSTLAAACLKYMDRGDWRDYVTGVFERGLDGRKTADIIRGWIDTYLRECAVTIEVLMEVSKTRSGEPEMEEKFDLLLARWKQIQQLCESAVQATAE